MRFIDKALYSTLTSYSDLTDLVGSGSPRIYNTLAPQNGTYPAVVFQKMGGGHVADNPVENIEAVYMIKAIASSLSDAEDVDFEIKNAVDRQSIGISGDDGFYDWAVFRGMGLHFIEDLGSGKVMYHIGALYDIRAAKS